MMNDDEENVIGKEGQMEDVKGPYQNSVPEVPSQSVSPQGGGGGRAEHLTAVLSTSFFLNVPLILLLLYTPFIPSLYSEIYCL